MLVSFLSAGIFFYQWATKVQYAPLFSNMQPDSAGYVAANVLDVHEHAVLPQDLAQNREISFPYLEYAVVVEDVGPAGDRDLEPRLAHAVVEKLIQHELHPRVHEHGRSFPGLLPVHLGQGEHTVDHAPDADNGIVHSNADTGSQGIGDQNISGVLGDLEVGDVNDAIGHK